MFKMYLLLSFVLFASICFSILLKFLENKFNFWKCRNVVGPKPTLFFGNFARVIFNKEHKSTVAAEIYNQYPNEKIVGFFKLTTPVLLIRDLEIIKHVLIKDFEYFQHRGIQFSKEGLGSNLIHSDGDTWNLLRKKFTPIFRPTKLKEMFYLINDRAEQFVRYIDSIVAKNNDLELGDLAAKFTAEVIGTCAFGVNIDAFNDKYNRYMDIGNKQLTPTFKAKLIMLFPLILKTLKLDLFSREVSDHYFGLVRSIVKEREGKVKLRNDFMDLLIELKEQGIIKGGKIKSDESTELEITESVLAAQAFAFFGAGFETSSVTMTLMLYELALNPDIQAKLIEEVDRILNNYEGIVSYEAIGEMSYLEMVLSETLRKYPVLDVFRKSVRDYKIPGTDLTLPKGTDILISVRGINKDPKFYPNPEQFDPERFSPENIKSSHSCAWLPFGAGPRDCIGARFARLEIMVGTVHFFKTFRVEAYEKTSTNLTFEPCRLTLFVKGGTWLTVKRR